MAKPPPQVTLKELFDFALEKTLEEFQQPVSPPVQWIEENFIDPVSETLIVLESYQKRIIRQALQVDSDGHSRYNLVVWSQPKKSGKTAIAAAVGAYVAHNIEAPNEVSTVANDKEQAAGRIFAAMLPTLQVLGWNNPVSQKGIQRTPASYGPNKSVVKAITTNYEKEAGANQGLSLWSELWAYKGERLTRLWEEMTPPPTRRFSMRWVESYAGFIGENILFQNIYLRIFKDFQEKELQPGVTKVWPDLPVYEVGHGTLIFWDHDHRMDWQTPQYYASQRDDLRVSSYTRLHGNWWVDSDDTFITNEMWQNSLRANPITTGKLTYALDGSKNGDSTALIGSIRVDDLVHTPDVYIWDDFSANVDGEVDYSAVENTVYRLHAQGRINPPLWYDEYQMAYLAQRLRKRGVPCKEFKQGADRIKSDTFLSKLYEQGKIINTASTTLRRHILSASIKEYSDQRVRIIKPVISPDAESEEDLAAVKKVDGAVAQSMSAYKAYHASAGGWGQSGI